MSIQHINSAPDYITKFISGNMEQPSPTKWKFSGKSFSLGYCCWYIVPVRTDNSNTKHDVRQRIGFDGSR